MRTARRTRRRAAAAILKNGSTTLRPGGRRTGGLEPGRGNNRRSGAEDARAARRTREIEEWTNWYLIHPLSLAFARFFNRLRIHPNAVSLTGMVCGIAAGVAYHHYQFVWAAVLGFILMIAWHVMDGADGQLARLSGKTSELGKILDGFSDHVAFAAVYVGLATAITTEIGFWGWTLAAVAGVSHFLQSTAYEFQRQSYDFWGRGKTMSRPEAPDRIRRRLAVKTGIAKLFGHPYLGYVRVQQKVAAFDPKLESILGARLGEADDPEEVREAYRAVHAGMVRRWSVLSSNYRTIAIFVACIFGEPAAFFLFEIFVLNVAALLLSALQKRRNRLLGSRLSL